MGDVWSRAARVCDAASTLHMLAGLRCGTGCHLAVGKDAQGRRFRNPDAVTVNSLEYCYTKLCRAFVIAAVVKNRRLCARKPYCVQDQCPERRSALVESLDLALDPVHLASGSEPERIENGDPVLREGQIVAGDNVKIAFGNLEHRRAVTAQRVAPGQPVTRHNLINRQTRAGRDAAGLLTQLNALVEFANRRLDTTQVAEPQARGRTRGAYSGVPEGRAQLLLEW
jgi:hypothetical protein